MNSENSFLLRVFVTLTITVSMLALFREELWPSWWPWAILITWFGFWMSWIRRNQKNWWLRGLLAIAMIIAGGYGISNIVSAPFDPRVALANLLLYLQIIHNFDTPSRKDLNYSLLVSLILMALASILSLDLIFGAYLIVYLVIAIISLVISAYRESEDHQAGKGEPKIKLSMTSAFQIVAGFFGLTLIFGFLFFLFVPRMQGFRFRVIPTARKSFFSGFHFFHGTVASPGYPVVPGQSSFMFKKMFHRFNPDSYFGFNPYLDLSLRGELSNRVVMQVKSQAPGYWRGLAFDQYTGEGWAISEQTPQSVALVNDLVELHPPTIPGLRYQQVVQTYHISGPLPNLVFSMYFPATIYFPASLLYQDSEDALRIPFYLEPGTVYTVISQVPEDPLPSLARSNMSYPERIKAHYLQLPNELPWRVKQLALNITGGKNGPYFKVMALIDWLRQYPYELNIPPLPSGRDAVDHFIFDLRKGYCEQFSSALAVMARSIGIPSRLVTGYATGMYNPVTMNYEVKEKDAHAWVEIYFADFGWVPFDPSPPYPGMPATLTKPSGVVGLSVFLGYVKSWIEDHLHFSLGLPQAEFPPAAKKIFFLLGGMVLIIGFFALGQFSAKNKAGSPKKDFSKELRRQRLKEVYLKLEKRLAKQGYVRQPYETQFELAEKLPSGSFEAQVKDWVLRYVEERYSLRPLSEDFFIQAKEILRQPFSVKNVDAK